MHHCDPAWLVSQRWFRAKQRPIASVEEVDRARLHARASLAVVHVTFDDRASHELYLVPLVDDHEPADGEGAWQSLADVMVSGDTLPAERGAFVATPIAAAEAVSAGAVIGALAERRLRVEQSNTSVVLGERLILKLYRLLESGENPDVEVSAFLTDAGFADTPAVAASLVYVDPEGARSAAAMLQAFVPSRGDAWSAMLAAIATDAASATRIAGDVGALTRGLHTALASRPDSAAFPVRAATALELSGWRASAQHQLALALDAVGGNERERLAMIAPRVSARFADQFKAGSNTVRVQRIHGDYHLGQLLARTDGGYSVIDFEGEPARPLAERRCPASPLRDVAGMLRSLDYAARTAGAPPASLAAVRAGFLAGYGGIDPVERGWVDAFELEKACYEVRYEAGNRPDWLWLPLTAVERLSQTRLQA